jgi:hypothetical protein
MFLLWRGQVDNAKALFEEHLAEYRKNPRNQRMALMFANSL